MRGGGPDRKPMRAEKKTSVRPPRTLPKGIPCRVTPSAISGCASAVSSGRRGCKSAMPLSSAVGHIASRLSIAVVISSGDQSQPVRLARSTIERITDDLVRAANGTSTADSGKSAAKESSSSPTSVAFSRACSSCSNSTASEALMRSSSQWWISDLENRQVPCTLRPGIRPREAIFSTSAGAMRR